MKKQLQQLDFRFLTAVFLASTFGSMSLTGFLTYATQPGAALTLSMRILLTIAGIVLYAVVLWLTFYLVLPEYRPALRHILSRTPRPAHTSRQPVPVPVERNDHR